ncbi:MAG TPA: haloalkane dehalogenase [Streptosporangiaceae bacterium]|nr:haloalkane dehalogenase [Streptosporangiaceae bacterium]
MKVLRTPDERFADLPDFPYEPRYAELGGLRLAYVEAGPAAGEPVLLLHGEPSWSFLYRQVIPVLADAGLRVIAADLIGFGRSDKPADVADHSYARHVEWIRAFAFDVLDLHGLTLVGQDWGGLIGLRLLAEHPERFARFVAANTGLPTGDQPMPDVWLRFREVVRTAAKLNVSRLVQSGCQTTLPQAVLDAYDAPFPDPAFAAAVRAMPDLVPAEPDNPASEANRRAWSELAKWDKPFLVAFSDRDPITGAMAPVLKQVVPGAAGIEHPVLAGAGHFLQEDSGPELGRHIAAFIQRLHPAARLRDHRGADQAEADPLVDAGHRRVGGGQEHGRDAPLQCGGGECLGDRRTQTGAAVSRKDADAGDLRHVTSRLAASRRDRTLRAEGRGDYRLT